MRHSQAEQGDRSRKMQGGRQAVKGHHNSAKGLERELVGPALQGRQGGSSLLVDFELNSVTCRQKFLFIEYHIWIPWFESAAASSSRRKMFSSGSLAAADIRLGLVEGNLMISRMMVRMRAWNVEPTQEMDP